jgi:hypothetical protein
VAGRGASNNATNATPATDLTIIIAPLAGPSQSSAVVRTNQEHPVDHGKTDAALRLCDAQRRSF